MELLKHEFRTPNDADKIWFIQGNSKNEWNVVNIVQKRAIVSLVENEKHIDEDFIFPDISTVYENGDNKYQIKRHNGTIVELNLNTNQHKRLFAVSSLSVYLPKHNGFNSCE